LTSVKNSKSYSLVRTVTERSLKSVVTLAIIAFVGLPHIDVCSICTRSPEHGRNYRRWRRRSSNDCLI